MLIIVHKSGQTSGTKLLRSSQSCVFSFGTLLQAYPSSLWGSVSSFLLSSCCWAGKGPSSPHQEFQMALVASESAGSRLSSSLPSSQPSLKGMAKFASLTRFKRISSLQLETKNPQVCSHDQTCSLNRCFAVAFF